MKSIDPEQIVTSCKYIEGGVRFSVEGIRCCCANTWQSPVIISAEEMKNGEITYDLIRARRRELFEALNGWNDRDVGDCAHCHLKHQSKYKDINFDYLGGHNMCSGFNIAHFSDCNLRCSYCDYTVRNCFVKPQYDNIIQFIEEFKSRNKILPNIWIEYNGGEPTLLKNFDEILNYLVDNNIGKVCVFSNAVKFSDAIYNGLKENKIFLTTSIDAGTPSTFKKVRGADAYVKVIENCIRYKKSGTNNFWLKYIILDSNRTDDDLYGFVFAMTAIHPNQVYICPDFPYGDREIPEETVKFGAKMWLLLEKYAGITPYIQSDDMKGDLKFAKFSKDIREEYAKLREKASFTDEYILNQERAIVCRTSEKTKKTPKNKVLRLFYKKKRVDDKRTIRLFGGLIRFSYTKERKK